MPAVYFSLPARARLQTSPNASLAAFGPPSRSIPVQHSACRWLPASRIRLVCIWGSGSSSGLQANLFEFWLVALQSKNAGRVVALAPGIDGVISDGSVNL